MLSRRDFLQAGVLSLAALPAGRVRADQTGPPADERVNQSLAAIRDQHHLPALFGAVVRGDTVTALGAVGVRKVGDPTPVKPGDQVHIGSDTKAMTATMLGTLVDEGKLDWSSTVRSVFGDRAKPLHADFQGVTLWNLLTHRAGLPANGPWRSLKGNTTTDQRRDLLKRMMSAAPAAPPGMKYAYTNVGYALAGLMAEQVTGESWEALMQARVFVPLGMASAGFGAPGTRGKVDQPWGHTALGRAFLPVQGDNTPALGPAGTVHCTLADWGKFAAQHMDEAAAKVSPRLLRPDTLQKLHTPPEKGEVYAGGWGVLQRPWAGGTALSHSGSNTMWYATIWVAPTRGFALLSATNAGGKDATTACDETIAALIEKHLAPKDMHR